MTIWSDGRPMSVAEMRWVAYLDGFRRGAAGGCLDPDDCAWPDYERGWTDGGAAANVARAAERVRQGLPPEDDALESPWRGGTAP